MAVIALSIEYDGGAYVGWQRQPNGISVQQKLEEALARVCGMPLRLNSAGRTDAGVHARGMVAHFEVERVLPLDAYLHGVNRLLPRDIAVRVAWQVADQFHARFSAERKWYRYSLYLSGVRSPLRDRFNWHYRVPLDICQMREAAQFFVGEHDFAAFRAVGCSAKTTIRRIDSIDLLEEGEQVHIDVRGSGFLRHMVRMMVGTLVQVGSGKRAAEDIRRLLAAGATSETRLTAPAQGLCLMQIEYPQYLLAPGGGADDRREKELDNTGVIG